MLVHSVVLIQMCENFVFTEPENLDESSDPFATNPDDNSAECGVKSSCEDNLYGDFEVHENAEKLDDEITYDHSVNFDPLKTDLISPVDRMFEEVCTFLNCLNLRS